MCHAMRRNLLWQWKDVEKSLETISINDIADAEVFVLSLGLGDNAVSASVASRMFGEHRPSSSQWRISGCLLSSS